MVTFGKRRRGILVGVHPRFDNQHISHLLTQHRVHLSPSTCPKGIINLTNFLPKDGLNSVISNLYFGISGGVTRLAIIYRRPVES